MFIQMFINVALGKEALITVFTVFDCYRLCTETMDCSSFFHSESEGFCQLSSTRYESTKGLNGVKGYNYYIMRPDCPSNWFVFEDQCYMLFTKATTASGAHDSCVKQGGFLAKIDSESDRDVIRQKLGQTSVAQTEKSGLRKKRELAKTASRKEAAESPVLSKTTTPTVAGNMIAGTAVWLGGSDGEAEGTWVWRDGSLVSVDGWKIGQPDNSTAGDDCMQQTAEGFWIDVDCSTLLAYLCEM